MPLQPLLGPAELPDRPQVRAVDDLFGAGVLGRRDVLAVLVAVIEQQSGTAIFPLGADMRRLLALVHVDGVAEQGQVLGDAESAAPELPRLIARNAMPR